MESPTPQSRELNRQLERLLWAIDGSDTNEIRKNITKSTVNIQGQYGETALVGAVRESDVELIKWLLEAGADPNIENPYSGTALMEALNVVTRETPDIVELLLQNGANPNFQDKDKNTPLISASGMIRDFTPTVVKLLLDAGADPNVSNKQGITPLINTVSWAGGKKFQVMDLLLAAGADPYPALEECMGDMCQKIISKAIWERMNENIYLQSRQLSQKRDPPLPKDLWRLILLRERQEKLCRDLTNDKNYYVLWAFAEMLNIPISEFMSKADLCKLISRQISWGGRYSEESKGYFEKEAGK